MYDTQIESTIIEKYSCKSNVLLDINYRELQSINANKLRVNNVRRHYACVNPFNDTVIVPKYTIHENDTSYAVLYSAIQDRFNHSAFNHFITEKRLKNSPFESYLKIYSIKSKITELQKSDNIETTLDYIFNTIDDLAIENQFQLINNLLEIIDISDLSIDIIVGVLTITSNWKNEISSRNSFYQQAYDYINELYLAEEANQILCGLE